LRTVATPHRLAGKRFLPRPLPRLVALAVRGLSAAAEGYAQRR